MLSYFTIFYHILPYFTIFYHIFKTLTGEGLEVWPSLAFFEWPRKMTKNTVFLAPWADLDGRLTARPFYPTTVVFDSDDMWW